MKTIYFLLFLGLTTHTYAQTWNELAPVPSGTGLNHVINFAIDGVGYLVTGNETDGTTREQFYSYNPETDIWTTLPDFPGFSRGYAYGVESEGNGYIGFGAYYNPVTFEYSYLNDIWEYNPDDATWTELAPCPCINRIHPAMVAVNNKIYMGLGGSAFGDLDDWWEFDIATNTWTEKASFPSTERHHPYYFGIGDYVYVGFGHHNSDIFNDFYRYDPATDSWTELESLPAQGRVAGTQFSYNDKGYVLSGQGETHVNLPTGEFWEYDPLLDNWSEMPAHPNEGRWAPGTFVIDDKVYFMCGESDTGNESDLWVFDFNEMPANIVEEEKPLLEIFPNPSKNNWVEVRNFELNDFQVNVYNSIGQLVLTGEENESKINVEKLQSGVYILSVGNETDSYQAKLIVE